MIAALAATLAILSSPSAPTAERAPLVSAWRVINRACFPFEKPNPYTAHAYRECVRPRTRKVWTELAPDAWPNVDEAIDRIILAYEQFEAGEVTRDSAGAMLQSAQETMRQQLERLALEKAALLPANTEDPARQRAEVRHLLEVDAFLAETSGHPRRAEAALVAQHLRCNRIGPDWYCASYAGPAMDHE
jgi:hypothetical protein